MTLLINRLEERVSSCGAFLVQVWMTGIAKTERIDHAFIDHFAIHRVQPAERIGTQNLVVY